LDHRLGVDAAEKAAGGGGRVVAQHHEVEPVEANLENVIAGKAQLKAKAVKPPKTRVVPLRTRVYARWRRLLLCFPEAERRMVREYVHGWLADKPWEPFEVELNAFQDGVIRIVRVPQDQLDGDPMHDLEQIFYWGQNDFQPVKDRCSVSMGDVVRYRDERWLCAMVGFQKVGAK